MSESFPGPRTRKGHLLDQAEQFAKLDDLYEALPPVLRGIAIHRAVETILLPESDLESKAKEIDTHSDPIAIYDRERVGSVWQNHIGFIRFLGSRSAGSGNSSDTTARVVLKQLRVDVAARSVREQMVKLRRRFDYQPGYEDIVTCNEDFRTTEELTRDLVKHLGNQQ